MLTVGWKDPSGAWVTVVDTSAGLTVPTSPDPLPLLLKVAADVRLGPPVAVFRPSYLEVDTPLTTTAWTADGAAPWIEMIDGQATNTTVAGRPRATTNGRRAA